MTAPPYVTTNCARQVSTSSRITQPLAPSMAGRRTAAASNCEPALLDVLPIYVGLFGSCSVSMLFVPDELQEPVVRWPLKDIQTIQTDGKSLKFGTTSWVEMQVT